MKVRELFEDNSGDHQLIGVLRSRCKNNFKLMTNGTMAALYRGASFSDAEYVSSDIGYEFARVTGRTSARLSLTGNNILMNYVSQAPSWKGYPRRELSAFCTPSYSAADNFSKPWLIIPCDESGPYAVSKDDFNMLDVEFETLLEHLETLKDFVIDMVRSKHSFPFDIVPELEPLLNDPILNKFAPPQKVTLEDISKLSKCIAGICRIADTWDSRGAVDKYKDMDKVYTAFLEFQGSFDNMTLEEWLETHITPQALDIKLCDSFRDLKPSKKSEIWFEGDYIAIRPTIESLTAKDLISSSWFKDIASQV